jgi:hypothetical protein
MRARTTVTAAALLAVLTACGSSEPAPPTYTVTNHGERQLKHGTAGHVELLMPTATVDQAQDAIRDYAQNIDGPATMYGIAVIRDTASTVTGRPAITYVCMGRWVKDEQASEDWTQGSITSDTWPAIGMNCPNND